MFPHMYIVGDTIWDKTLGGQFGNFYHSFCLFLCFLYHRFNFAHLLAQQLQLVHLHMKACVHACVCVWVCVHVCICYSYS